MPADKIDELRKAAAEMVAAIDNCLRAAIPLPPHLIAICRDLRAALEAPTKETP